MNAEKARNVKVAAAGAGGLLLLLFLAFKVLGGRNLSAEPQAVPQAGVGPDTLAVVKLNLSLVDDRGSLWERLFSGAAEAESKAGALNRLCQGLAGRGVTQVVVPVNAGWSTLEGLGVYLGGDIRANDEELEAAIMESGSGSLLAASALLTSINRVGQGWRFWGIGGGEISTPDSSVARRYEAVFQAAPPAALQMVVLVSRTPGAAGADPSSAASTPRLFRQFSRLAASVDGMQAFRLTLSPAQPGGSGGFGADAMFDTPESASRFVTSWKALAGDLAQLSKSFEAAEGLEGVGSVLGAIFGKARDSAPVAEGRWVQWKLP